ncbi:mycofactocin biosynthesis peptidyl-dipeptidase MftE [Arthrobacter gandavensis]|nr:mycofactocin biosynthesis peptidyl-dipeptidase MftE [Arthrobacter gandavensis]
MTALTWPQVPAGPVVLVPVGSTEQHGPHLPLDTDTVIAAGVAHAAAEEWARTADGSRAAAVVAPALAYGASGEHQHFPGTVSIGQEALGTVLVELVRSLAVWAGSVVFVNAHGGNVQTLARTVPQLIAEGHRAGWVHCRFDGADAHAGRTETSLMLHLAPERVQLHRAEPGNTATVAELLPAMTAGGVQAVSANGVLGDPVGASAEEGRILLGGAVADLLRRLPGGADRHGILQPLPEGGPVPDGMPVPKGGPTPDGCLMPDGRVVPQSLPVPEGGPAPERVPATGHAEAPAEPASVPGAAG